ncbi:MAG: protein kinase [Methanoregula sp.]|jgi:HD superfamily phosphohydrolase|uniref:protein kinase domain-containing protein n=1 Tax=Methanoregula sp. TaxID=2052170 RepID=UPI003D10ACDC
MSPELVFTEKFYEKLRSKYLSNLKNGEMEWKEEHPILQKLFPILQKNISSRYSIIEPINVGGNGIILKIKDENLKVFRALKMPRPKPTKIEVFSEIIKEEVAHLLEIRHPNVIEIYFHEKIIDETGSFPPIPFYVMEFITDARDGFEYFSECPRTLEEILHMFKQIIDGIDHLHDHFLVHLDIKLENMLISSDGRAVLSDLGSTRHLKEGAEEIIFPLTESYAHPELLAKILPTPSPFPEPNRVKIKFKRSDLKPIYDLYALGKNISRIFKFHEPIKYKGLDFYSRKYLELLSARLLDGRNSLNETALGLPITAFKDLKYNNIKEVKIDLRKITGEYILHTIIPEINEHGIQTIQTSSLSVTVFTPRLSKIVENSAFRRLSDITQLGFINLIYPTATHSRLEHVLGTYSNMVRYCDALFHDPVNPLFKQIMTEDDLKAAFLAALLHDLGQYPLAHDFEEAELELFSHKTITLEMLRGDVSSPSLQKLRDVINNDWGISPQKVIDIIDANPEDHDSPIKERILNTLLDSPIDADKLDYLVRDSINLNIPYGKAIDYERLLRVLTVIFEDLHGKVYISLGIHEKGRVPAETIAFVRYAMFGSVYWHHTSRVLKVMLHRAIWEGLLTNDNSAKRKKYKKDFYDFIYENISEKQLKLDETQELTKLNPTQLSSSDKKMIEWVAKHTTPTGFKLLQMLVNRDKYKRILVISNRKNPAMWDDLIKFRNTRYEGWKKWKNLVKFQEAVQKNIIESIRNIDDTQRISSVLSPSKISDVIRLDEQGVAIILVDIPEKRKTNVTKMKYLPEAFRHEMIEQWKTPTPLEDSEIWNRLNNSFLESVGKIRVFCHPDVSETINAAISMEGLEKILNRSMRFVESMD